MTWIPSIELIETIFEEQLKRPAEYLNKNHLESALDVLHFGFPFRNEPLSIFEQAAVLMRNIVQYQVFIDGCKRIGIHVSYVFLWKNRFVVHPPDPEEMFKFPMAVAKGDLTLKYLAKWFRDNSKELA